MRSSRIMFGSIAGVLVSAAGAVAQDPDYQFTVDDCVTGDNAFFGDDGARYWDVDPGCDIYQIDVYERPTVKEYRDRSPTDRFGSNEYFEYLDVESASVGADDRYLFVRIDLYGRDNSTSDGDDIPVGMMERYGFRISADPDGRHGMLIVSDQPEVKNEPNTVFGPIGVFGYRDTNGDVGGADRDGPTGLEVTKTDNPNEESGLNGFDRVEISDGRLEGGSKEVAWVRLDPLDDTVVELAVDYVALGYTEREIQSLRYFDVEAIKGGPKDPQNYLWNDKYADVEAGSPNPGPGDDSEFGTEGLENVYEVDTVRVGDLSDLTLEIDPTSVDPGQVITLSTYWGGSGAPVGLAVTDVDGVPTFAFVLFGQFDTTHKWTVAAIVPPGLSGFDVTFRSYGITVWDRVAETNPVVVTFR